MTKDIAFNAAFGLLFFLASSYMFDLVCREQYIDNTPIPYEEGDDCKTRYVISYAIFFFCNMISLGFMAFSGALIGYMFVQLAIIFLSMIKIHRGDSETKYIIITDVISVFFLVLLIVIKFCF